LLEPQLSCDFGNLHHEMAKERLLIPRGRSDRLKRLLGNEQNVGGGLGVYVLKGQTEIVLEHNLRRDFLIDDLLKYRHATPFPPCARRSLTNSSTDSVRRGSMDFSFPSRDLNSTCWFSSVLGD